MLCLSVQRNLSFVPGVVHSAAVLLLPFLQAACCDMQPQIAVTVCIQVPTLCTTLLCLSVYRYLSFVQGIVDSDTLPLQVSRESLQQHAALKTMKKKLVRKALDMIRKLADAETDFAAEDADSKRLTLNAAAVLFQASCSFPSCMQAIYQAV